MRRGPGGRRCRRSRRRADRHLRRAQARRARNRPARASSASRPWRTSKRGDGPCSVCDDAQRMLGVEDDGVAAVEPEGDAAIAPFAFALHLDRAEGGAFDLDVELFDGRDQHVAAVGLAPEHGREQPDHRRPADRRALVIPGAVARDPHARMAAVLGIPLIDRRQPALVDQLLQLGEAESLKVDRWAASRASATSIGLLRAPQLKAGVPLAMQRMSEQHRHRRRQARRRARSRPRCSPTAGASSRMSITTMDEVPDGAVKVVADLEDRRLRRRDLRGSGGSAAGAAAGQQCGALRLGRIRRVRCRASSPRTWRSTSRAPALLIERFARASGPRRRFAGRQSARFEACRAQPRLSQLHAVEAGARRLDGACRACACAARNSRQRHRAGADAAVERPERGEFRSDACEQPAAARGRAGRCHRRDPLSHRRAMRDGPDAGDRFRASVSSALTATCSSWSSA